MMPREELTATSQQAKRSSSKPRDAADSARLSPNAAVESGSNSSEETKIVSDKLTASAALQAPTLVSAIKAGRKKKPSKPPPSDGKAAKDSEQPPKKAKRKRAKKDRAQPKRPLSAYNIFFKEERVNLLEGRPSANISADRQQDDEDIRAHGKLGFEKLAKVIGHRWQNLPPDRLEYYQKLASEDSERYRREMDVYVANKKEKKQAAMAAEQLLTHDIQDGQEQHTKGRKKKRSGDRGALDQSPGSARATLSDRMPLSPSAMASLPHASPNQTASLAQQQAGRALGAFGYQLSRDASLGALGGAPGAPTGVGADSLALARSALGLPSHNLTSLLGFPGASPAVDALGLGASSRLGLGAGIGGFGSQVPPAAMQLYLEQLMVERDQQQRSLLHPSLLGGSSSSLQSDAMRNQLLASLLQQQAQFPQLPFRETLLRQRRNEGQDDDQDDSRNEDTGTSPNLPHRY